MVDVSGGGHIGFALEVTHGSYQAPTNYAAVESESLTEERTDPYRNLIVGRAVTSGKLPGRASVSGNIKMECIPETLIFFAYASRMSPSIVKTGVGPFVYTMNDVADVHIKSANRSLTIVGDRAGVGFAYLGCQVVSWQFSMDDGIPKVELGIIGREQTEDYTPGSVTMPTETPFGAADSSVTIAASSRVDLDSIEVSLDDSGEAKFNIDGNTAASYIKYGEHVSSASFEVDFENKADYLIWVARTTQELIWTMDKGANQIITLELHAAIYDQFEVGLGGMGDQVMASAELRGVYDASATQAFEMVLTTDIDLSV